jgi:putative glutamine amidotransferase
VSRPRIGVTAYAVQARFGAWDVPATLIPQTYVEGVRLAGGLPLVLPPTVEGAERPGDVLDALHGLVLTGGPDLAPELYGAERHPETQTGPELRDRFELALAREARRRGLPVLGICRGMQLLNVAAGGDLRQHLADELDLALHRPAPGRFGRHPVELDDGTHAAGLLGAEVEVHSTHHQGVGRVGAGLRVSGRAPDGTVEALEDPELPFCLGVLWHPEEAAADGGAPLFRGLVEAAGQRVRG